VISEITNVPGTATANSLLSVYFLKHFQQGDVFISVLFRGNNVLN